MPAAPRVSCIINFYDAEQFLIQAIASVLAQTYADWELLLVDDGSTDSSTEIARRYAHENPAKIRYLEPEGHQSRGMCAARNLGIDQARGEFIGFLDANDEWLSLKLEQQVAILRTHPEAGMVYGRTQIWYGWTGNPDDGQYDCLCELGVSADEVIPPPKLFLLSLANQYQTATIGNVLIRRHLFTELGAMNELLPYRYANQAWLALAQLKFPAYVASEIWKKSRYRRSNNLPLNEQPRDDAEHRSYLEFLKTQVIASEVQNKHILNVIRDELDKYDVNAIKSLIDANFPHFASEKIAYLNEGENNRAYRVNNQYIFRFPKHFQAERSLIKEIEVLRVLRNLLPIPIPDCQWIGNSNRLLSGQGKKSRKLKSLLHSSTMLLGRASKYLGLRDFPYRIGQGVFVGYQEIHGSFLYEDFIRNSSREIIRDIACSLGSFLSTLHALPISIFNRRTIPEKRCHHAFFHQQFRRLKRDVFPVLGSDDITCITEVFGEFLTNANACLYRPAILHGDFNWDHIIIDEKTLKVVGIIDFGGVFIGDPTYGLVSLWLKYGDNFLRLVLSNYPCNDPEQMIRKIKCYHFCDCVDMIHRGKKNHDQALLDRGWFYLRNHLKKITLSN